MGFVSFSSIVYLMDQQHQDHLGTHSKCRHQDTAQPYRNKSCILTTAQVIHMYIKVREPLCQKDFRNKQAERENR